MKNIFKNIISILNKTQKTFYPFYIIGKKIVLSKNETDKKLIDIYKKDIKIGKKTCMMFYDGYVYLNVFNDDYKYGNVTAILCEIFKNGKKVETYYQKYEFNDNKKVKIIGSVMKISDDN